MEWQSPHYLYLILPLCLGWPALALYSENRRQRARESFVSQAMWSKVLPESSRARFWLKLILKQVAIISGLIALARPQFGTQLEEVVPRGSDLYVLIDVSRSMLANDVPPSRLERAKADVSALVNRLEGERVGLIAFAGQAVVKCPLTVDYDSFRRALNELDPNSAPRGGTAIGDAIRKAIEVFHAKAERDQAVLLITDGDDQESYPLEAATVAAERKVTIFAVGLGDADQGARVPQKDGPGTFVEHEGQQIWSKLDGSLLQEIALKTSGVYIPAGTRAYDLGELYASHLQGRKGDDSETQQRIRKSERFQIFLAITLLALFVDLFVSRYTRPVSKVDSASSAQSATKRQAPVRTKLIASVSLLLMMLPLRAADGGESHNKVREGLHLYQQEKYEAAGKEFAAAAEELEKEKSEKAAIAAFDEACAYHRNGDHEKARDRYLSAGLSSDRSIAMASHFNLGTMAAEKARTLAGERPEDVAADKRQEILNELKQAVASYRHCLELQSDHVQARKNLELVRNWIKYYTDRWRELDRQKLRDESNLIQFLEFLMQTESALQESVRQLPENVSADVFAEIKRAQDELGEEIPILREKIATELTPQDPQTAGTANALPKEVEEGISLLQSWADKAGDKMASVSRQLSKAEITETTAEQQAAIDELDRIWDAVIPFQPLLAKELKEQTSIARTLMPEPPADDVAESNDSVATDDPNRMPDPVEAKEPETQDVPAEIPPSPIPAVDTIVIDASVIDTSEPDREQRPGNVATDLPSDEQLEQLTELQEKTLRKARLLAPKAEAELERLESQPIPEAAPPQPSPQATDPSQMADASPDAAQPQVDPEQVKAGLRKAIELAPKAVNEMQSAVQNLQKKDVALAGVHAEEARRILEEIQRSQPKDPQQDQQDQKDQQDQDKDQDQQNKDDKQDEDKKNDQQQDQKNQDKKQDDQKKDDQKKQDEKKSDDKQKKKQNDKKQDDKKQDAGKQSQPQQVSNDRIEEALRKVRERQQEKRERDQKARATIFGRAPVDKDW